MKLNCAETLLVNNPFRALSQRYFEAPFFRRIAGALDGARVLEIGCGRAIDLDPAQLRRAHHRLGPGSALAAADAEQLPFPDASFDAVADFGALHHVPDWQRAVSEIARVLRPGGRFLFGEVTAAALRRPLQRLLLDHPIENRFSESGFLAELAAHSLRPLTEPRRIFFNDIFLGAATRLC